MHLFYCPDITGTTYTLPEEESGHCIRVLRLKPGDIVHITDGRGNMHECRITGDNARHCSVEIINTNHSPARSPAGLHVAIAPTKSIERFEWFLEKATEIGIDVVTPLFCSRSERSGIKLQRLEKVMVAAMKQSLKSWLPEIRQPEDFSNFIKKDHPGLKFIAWCGTGTEQHLKELLVKGSDALILIGPEGDFTHSEIETAISNGFTAVSLGTSRLRTETAGVVACTIFVLENE
jgi:16S rRNA (uracil1498-N3)-methyltransferase